MLDETTGNEQDTSSGKTGQSSDKGSGSTSKDKGKLYNVAAIAKIKSDAAAEAGRQRKAAEVERDTFKQDLQAATGRLDTLERASDEARIAEARDDPDKLRTYQREATTVKGERTLIDGQRDLARREEQLKADRAEIDKDRGVVSVAYIAAKHGIEATKLEAYGISDPEILEKVAVDLSAGKSGEEGGEGKEGEEGFTLDSGATIGGVGSVATLEKANEAFNKGEITSKQLEEVAAKVK